MDLFEHGTEEQLRREEAAERLRELADQLARHNKLSYVRDGVRYTVDVPGARSRSRSATRAPSWRSRSAGR